jgi:2-dehydro-3-deoxyphosphooctonate aldolase (KDO 8-P synthase)
MTTRRIEAGTFAVGGGGPLAVVAGPCVVEDEGLMVEVATELKRIAERLALPFCFKASYDKANRTSLQSFRGPGLEEGLKLLAAVKEQVGVPILSDVHEPGQVGAAAAVLDIVQIPAFLSRQTDLLAAAADTGKPVNIKKSQMMAPWDMKAAVGKLTGRGNENVILTERGSSFGYNNLVVDMRGLPIMRALGYPVLFDATHAVQRPAGAGSASSGERQFVQIGRASCRERV